MSKKKKHSGWDNDYEDERDQYQETMKKYPKVMPEISGTPGVFLGQHPFHEPYVYYGMPQGSEGHMAIIGGSGTGKSSGIVKPTLKTWTAPLLATDIKGELSDFYKELYRDGLVKRPYLIFDPMQVNTPCYDPFQWLMDDSQDNLSGNIGELSFAIAPKVHDDQNKFWYESERNFLSAALLYYYNRGLSFSQTMCEIASKTLSEHCKRIVNSSDVESKVFLGEMVNLKKEQLAAIDRGVRNKIAVLATDKRIAHAFRGVREGANCFSWSNLEQYNIFLRIPETQIEQWGPVIRLMYVQLIRHLERRPDKYSVTGVNTSPILLLMDEFARFGKVQALANATSTLRSKNVNICMVMQSFAQLDKNYGADDRRIIMDNCSYISILGANDPGTQEELSKLIGQKKVTQTSKSELFDEYKDTTGYSVQKSEVYEPIILPADLARLDDVIILSEHGVQRADKFKGHDISEQLYQSSFRAKSISGLDNLPENDNANESSKPEQSEKLNNEVVKMKAFIERVSEADIKIKNYEQKAEYDAMEEQEAIKKAELNRFCAIGELVVKHFPGLNSLDPGKTKAEKTRNFQPLDAFLKALASKPELVREIAEMVQFKELL